ncbi:MAG: hypothetical protein GYB65_22415, partial [Chloroflexi bacterium]|nr:hypothetical protein [Chloroflexota bacterium]
MSLLNKWLTLARLIVLLAVAGLLWRLALLERADWRYDYDEAMAGLQALHITQGERPVFHPGQPYLAALESYLIAPLFTVLGANAVTLKLVPWLLSGGYILTTGWLGWRAFGPQVGLISALLAAFAPTYLLVTGMKTWGATAETLVLGNLLLISAGYALDPVHENTIRLRAVLALGFVGGVAFWVSWLVAFYALPVLIVMSWRGRMVLRRWWWALVGLFALGSLPFWVYNLGHDFATFRYLFSDQGNTWGNARAVIDHLNYDLSPRLVSGDPDWRLLSWPATWWLQIMYEGGLITLVVAGWRTITSDNPNSARLLVALFVLLLPIIYVASGYGNHALNEFGFDATGRYVLMIHSVLPVGVGVLCRVIAQQRLRTIPLRGLAAGVLTSVIGLNMLGTFSADPQQVFV